MIRNLKTVGLMSVVVMLIFWGSRVIADSSETLLMATTTSTDNTGLLDVLIPEFTTATGIELKWVATGTGKALKLGENCDADVLLVHAPGAEKQYVESGFGVDRREIMYNDFVVIGPDTDPAGLKGRGVAAAFNLIKAKGAVFVSRGDNSGTHKKEKNLWRAANIPLPDKESWYVQSGQGMLATINIAAERNGYSMTDRGTFIKYADTMGGNPPLHVLVEGDAVLLNPYSVMIVNPERCKNVKAEQAGKFSDWLASPEAQKHIADFKLLGKTLFTPNAK